jgi:PIN domain nuclease of toxin-antitoxin system
MKLLLDTHLLLWAASAPDKLSHTAKKLIEAPWYAGVSNFSGSSVSAKPFTPDSV